MANTTSKSNGKKSNTKKATAKKKTTNTRNSSSTSAKKAAETRRQNAAERKRKAELAKKNEKIVKEVYLWIFVAVSLLLFLSNFGICGIVGNTLRSVMLGVFGSMGYVFPIILVIVVGLMAYNEANILVVSKITGFLLLFITVAETFSFNELKFFKLSFNIFNVDLVSIVVPLMHFFNEELMDVSLVA